MKVSRTSGLAGLTLVGALALTACGSDNNSTVNAGAAPTESAGASVDCATGTLSGAGSTFQKNIMDEWTKGFLGACSGANVDYQPVGSGAGIAQFTAGTVDFAGSDAAMKDDEAAAAAKRCGGNPAVHLPMTAGGIAFAYKLSGVDSLKLSAASLAGIFEGTVTTWDAAEIKKDNPGTSLPSTKIQSIHRSDSSGSTSIISKYLDANAKDTWTLGTGKELPWPASTVGAKGSDGVTAAVSGAEGSITYVETSFAENAGLSLAEVSNGAGEFVALTPASVSAEVGGFSLPATGDDLKLDINYASTTSGGYPVVGVTYEIVCSKGTDAATLALLKRFLTYTAGTGQSAAEGAGFAPLPDSITTRVSGVVAGLA